VSILIKPQRTDNNKKQWKQSWTITDTTAGA